MTQINEDNGGGDDGVIDKGEFMQLLQIPEALKGFSQMGVDPIGLIDLTDVIFKKEDSKIGYGDFIDLLIKLRGSNQSTVKDIMDLRKFFTSEMVILHEELRDIMVSCNE